MSTKKTYPNVAQSWGIVGVAILAQVIFSPVLLMLKDPLGQELAMLMFYVFSMGSAFYFAHYIRKKETTINLYLVKSESIKVLIVIAIFTVAAAIGIADPLARLIPMPQVVADMFKEMLGDKGVFTFLTVVIAAPILEELIFRGVILDGLLKKYSPRKAILVSSFLFGFMHLNPWQFVAAMIIGVLVGWVYYKTNNLLLCILIHFVNNCMSFVISFFEDVEVSMNQSFIESYGGVLNAGLVISCGILVAGVCFYVLKKEFSSRVNLNEELRE